MKALPTPASMHRTPFRFSLALWLLLSLEINAQQLELGSSSASASNGPVTTATSTFYLNTGTSTTFTAYAPAITYTVAFSNQQYTTAATPGLTIGAQNSGSTTTSIGSDVVLQKVNANGSPSNTEYTSDPFGTAGTNFDVVNNYGYKVNTDAYYQLTAGAPLNARNYYGDMTITFSRPVLDPVIHLAGIGGSPGAGMGYYTEFELSTANVTVGYTLTRLSGTTYFNITGTKILNSSTTPVTVPGSSSFYSSQAAGNNGSGGSVLVNTGNVPVTSITFRVYLRGDGGIGTGNTWAGSNRSGDGYIISASLGLRNITGTVYDDANGLVDNTINGTGTNAGGTLFANLVDQNGSVFASATVAADGTYSFTNIVAGNYTLVLTTTAASTAAALPTGYLNTGEKNGSASGSDGTVNGTLVIPVTNANISNANFGIDKIPTANAVNGSYINPGTSGSVTAPVLTGNDAEDGAYNGTSGTNTVIINTLPASGTLKYNGVAVTAGQTIAGYNPALLTYTPATNSFTGTVSFTYSEVDAAGKSSTAATASMTFSLLTISGNIYDDANGLKDNIVNKTGTTANNAAGISAVLVNTVNNKVAATIAVTMTAGTGAYSFNINSGSFYVMLTANTATVGSAPPAISLPSGWANVGENLGAAAGSDGIVDGKLSLGAVNTNITNANFGIDMLPSGTDIIYIISPVPTRGSTHALTSTYRNMQPLNYSDAEDCASGCPSTFGVIIQSFNSMNGNQLAYNGTVITSTNMPFTIPAYNPDLLKITFNQLGVSSFSFYYKLIDAAGVQSIDPNYTVSWGSGVLAENLLNLTATQQATKALLQWSTATGSINDKFMIERSADGSNWQPLATINGRGNTSTKQGYSYTDNNPLTGDNYYRIMQHDSNGNNRYSPIRLLKFAEEWKVSLYPNPVAQGGIVKLTSNQPVKQISVTDLRGRALAAEIIKQANGNYSLQAAELAGGIYFITVTIDKGNTKTAKLVKENNR